MLWCARQKCVLELEGEVGFFRDAVGVLYGNSYVDTPGSTYNDFEGRDETYRDKVRPPKHVDAYHKHDCLCVLGHGDKAVRQLLDWLDQLRANGAVIRVVPREFAESERHPLNIMLHGVERAIIEFE